MLCNVCQEFDIQALFSECRAREAQESATRFFTHRSTRHRGFPRFLKHRLGINDVKLAADAGCELCTAIWQSWSRFLGEDGDQRKPHGAGFSQDQLYLGCSEWAPAENRIPYLTVTQTTRDIDRTLCMFEIVAERDKVPYGFNHLIAQEVHSLPSSEGCLQVARQWLKDCLSNHKRCSVHPPSQQLPTRVIDVGPNLDTDKVRLVETQGASGSWAALSYCWGGTSEFILTTTNLENKLRCMPLGDFPATLRDAVVVTRSLGIKYLWIDALCILQDSEEDWSKEASLMDSVYAGAKITILATSSPGANHGIFQARESASTKCQLMWKLDKEKVTVPVYLRSGTDIWDISPRSGPLNARAWTLQENLLSPRALSYQKQQMVWDCLEHSVGEDGRRFLSDRRFQGKSFVRGLLKHDVDRKHHQWLRRFASLDFGRFENPWKPAYEEPYDQWLEIVREYTTRNLTVATDVLSALSGLARKFQKLLDDKYCAGLWAGDMVRGLMWTRPALKLDEAKQEGDHPPPPGYRVPSWSWASIRGQTVTFFYSPPTDYRDIREQARIFETRTEKLSSDAYGQTKGGYIDIEGPFQEIHDLREKTTASEKARTILESKLSEQYAEDTGFHAEFQQQHQGHDGQSFALLILSRRYGTPQRVSQAQGHWIKYPSLVLLVLETTGEGRLEYRRVGIFNQGVIGVNSGQIVGMEVFDDLEKHEWESKRIRLV